jgi:tryptophan halogenase
MKIVIVGGGSAGWITASWLQKHLICDLTIIHKKVNDPIGVGEGTTPNINKAVDHIDNWQDAVGAVKKFGILFKDFYDKKSIWWHLFDDAFINSKGIDSIEAMKEFPWDSYKIPSLQFNAYHGKTINACFNLDHSWVPKNNCAWHIMADKFGDILKNNMSDNNFTIIKNTVIDVKLNDNGIEYLLLDDKTKISADYYFDCTGFERLLISKLTDFEKYDDMIADSFIVGPIPRTTVRPYTVSTAKKHGWQWEIDTQERRNSGYVYCSSLISDEEAQKESLLFETSRRFVSGKMKRLAVKNVISNGLAQSFIEPLEATSIMITVFTLELFVQHLNQKTKLNINQFENDVNQLLMITKEFVKLHYVLSRRKDSEWWKYWTSQPNNINAIFRTTLENKVYAKFNDASLNHFNIASMMIGYNCFP